MEFTFTEHTPHSLGIPFEAPYSLMVEAMTAAIEAQQAAFRLAKVQAKAKGVALTVFGGNGKLDQVIRPDYVEEATFTFEL